MEKSQFLAPKQSPICKNAVYVNDELHGDGAPQIGEDCLISSINQDGDEPNLRNIAFEAFHERLNS